MSNFKIIPLDKLDHNPPELLARPLPTEKDKDWEKVIEFCDSIEKVGLLNFFSVREVEGKFYVTDGNHRLMAIKKNMAEGKPGTAARYAEGLPCNVVEMDDVQSLAAQLSGNHGTFNQSAGSMSNGIYKLIVSGYDMAKVCKTTGMSEATVNNYLKIVKLPADIKAIIDKGSVTLSNAVQLTKLPVGSFATPEKANAWVEKAITQVASEFALEVANEIKAVKSANSGEKRAAEFVPEARLRSKEELSQKYSQALYSFEEEPTDTNRVALEVLKWIFQLDDTSVSSAKAAYETKKADAEQAKKDREAKRNAEELKKAKALIAEQTGVNIDELLK